MLSFRTKSEWIIALDKDGLLPKEIAAIVGCRPEYVRVVARQRKGTGMSKNDRRYRTSSLGRATEKIWRDGRVEAEEMRRAILSSTADLDRANREAREAYAAARANGESVKVAAGIGRNIRSKIIRQTGDQKSAREAYTRISAESRRQFNLQPTEAIHEHA